MSEIVIKGSNNNTNIALNSNNSTISNNENKPNTNNTFNKPILTTNPDESFENMVNFLKPLTKTSNNVFWVQLIPTNEIITEDGAAYIKAQDYLVNEALGDHSMPLQTINFDQGPLTQYFHYFSKVGAQFRMVVRQDAKGPGVLNIFRERAAFDSSRVSKYLKGQDSEYWTDDRINAAGESVTNKPVTDITVSFITRTAIIYNTNINLEYGNPSFDQIVSLDTDGGTDGKFFINFLLAPGFAGKGLIPFKAPDLEDNMTYEQKIMVLVDATKAHEAAATNATQATLDAALAAAYSAFGFEAHLSLVITAGRLMMAAQKNPALATNASIAQNKSLISFSILRAHLQPVNDALTWKERWPDIAVTPDAFGVKAEYHVEPSPTIGPPSWYAHARAVDPENYPTSGWNIYNDDFWEDYSYPYGAF